MKHTFSGYNRKTGSIFSITVKQRKMGSAAFKDISFFDFVKNDIKEGAKELDGEIEELEKKIFRRKPSIEEQQP